MDNKNKLNIRKFSDIPMESIVKVSEKGAKYVCGTDSVGKKMLWLINRKHYACEHLNEYKYFPNHDSYRNFDIMEIEYKDEIIFKRKLRRELDESERYELIKAIINICTCNQYKIFIDDVEFKYCTNCIKYNKRDNTYCKSYLCNNIYSIEKIINAKKIEVEE